MEKGEWMNGLTFFDLRSPVEPEWGRNTGSAEQVIMVDRKEHHDMTDKQQTQRNIMPGGVQQQCYMKEDKMGESLWRRETWRPNPENSNILPDGFNAGWL